MYKELFSRVHYFDIQGNHSHYWYFFEPEILVGKFFILEYILREQFSSYDYFRNGLFKNLR